MENRNKEQKTMDEMNDEELFIAYRAGDGVALEVLVERVRVPLFRAIFRHVGERTAAEDIFQDTIERVMRHRRQYDPSKPFRGWLWSIAKNRALDHLRTRGREVLRDDIEMEHAAAADPESVAAGREAVGRLSEAIRALPEEQREVFLMREEAGMSFADIAKATGAPLGTVLSRMHYALNKLKEVIEEPS